MPLARERPRNPLLLTEILETIKKLDNKAIEPTFNAILNELANKKILAFHRSLRKYLDLLVFAKLLTVKKEEAAQPNIREKQIYHIKDTKATLEAGEQSLLLQGLN